MNSIGASHSQQQKVVQYSSICIDMNLKFLMQNLMQFLKADDRDYMKEEISRIFLQDTNKEDLLITLSVRTAFDAFLAEMNYPYGTEIICSAMNIPQMATIIRYHGLTPIPVEIDVKTLSPKIEDLEAAITPKSKVMLISALFGTKVQQMDKIAELCQKHNIFLIEDLAEGFSSLNSNGYPLADLSFFSFGTIKTLSALGGGLTVIRNNKNLAKRLEERINSYPVASNYFYMKKCLKACLAIFMLQTPYFQKYKLVPFKLGFDHQKLQEFAISLIRGFNVKPDEFLLTFRKQIPNPMMAMLLLRLRSYNDQQMQQIIEKQLQGAKLLEKNGIIVPGSETKNRNFWLYPIVVENKLLVYKMLLLRGIEVYLGATQLNIIEPPLGSSYQYPSKTKEFFDNLIYLPINQFTSPQQILLICREVIETVNKAKKMKSHAEIARL